MFSNCPTTYSISATYLLSHVSSFQNSSPFLLLPPSPSSFLILTLPSILPIITFSAQSTYLLTYLLTYFLPTLKPSSFFLPPPNPYPFFSPPPRPPLFHLTALTSPTKQNKTDKTNSIYILARSLAPSFTFTFTFTSTRSPCTFSFAFHLYHTSHRITLETPIPPFLRLFYLISQSRVSPCDSDTM